MPDVSASRANRLLKRFELAHENLVFMGTMPPEDHDDILREYARARRYLMDALLPKTDRSEEED